MEIMNNTNTSISNISKNASSSNMVKTINNQMDIEENEVLNNQDNEKSFNKIISETFQNSKNNENESNNNILKDNSNMNNLIFNIKNSKVEKDNEKIDKSKLTKTLNKKDNNNFDIISQVESELLNQTNYAINNIESLSKINNNFCNETNYVKNNKNIENVFLSVLSKDTYGNVKQINMTKDDVEFFANVVDVNLKNQNNNFEINESNLKSAKISNALIEMLNDSRNNGRPVRVDFDNNISVILQVTKDGKLNARFYPGDKAAEEYLRQNIQILKNQLDSNDVEYENISYKERNNQQNNSGKNKHQNQKQKEDN